MKTTLIAVAAAITALSCQAITFPFTVTAPTWNKVAECTTEGGVNVRKLPSTTAPKMVYNESKIEDYDTPVIYYAYWGTKTGGPVQAITFSDFAPVVSEKPGWIELYKVGPKAESNGWVSSKFCKVSEITPIQPDSPNRHNFMFLNTPGVEGTYGIYFTYDEMNSLATFYIGRLENGKIVCPYSFDCEYGENTYEDNAKPSLLKNEYGFYSLISTKQSMSDFRPSPTSEDSYPVTDIRKFPSNFLNTAIKQAEPLKKPATVYMFDGGYCFAE